ncbi:MAG TPA: PHB depolymerase family esterase [Mucilaginibacter sp.]|jgi:polyhydroxybutyrate depolymerase|nr:PHB depolymerase family esterase [Mucilaginibacter sp.]
MKALAFLSFLSIFISTAATAQQKNESIIVDHTRREFITYLPSGLGDKAPVIISLHGRLGKDVRQMAFADFRPLADRDKFIIVCPQGVERSWNDGRGTPANSRGINDVEFIDELITYMINTYHADSSRIYVTGMSNGGFMTSRLACELSNHIAAIAVVAASMDQDMGYQPAQPMPVMYIQGTKDPLVPFNGGKMKGAGGVIYSHEDILKKWAAVDKCDSKPVVTNLPILVNDGTSVVKQEYTNSNGLKVIGFTIVDGGHVWPGGTQYLPKFIIGPLSRNLNACDEIWKFFKENKLSTN